MRRRIKPIRISSRIRNMSDAELKAYRWEMSRTVGAYAGRQYDMAIAEDIRRENESEIA